eukprot:SAG31_NODE_1383_length_8578_cov_3.660573_10_plen_84_part_00
MGFYFLVFCATIREIRDFIREKYGTNRESAALQWTCTTTAGDVHEGGGGEHMVSQVSSDQGLTWSGEGCYFLVFVALFSFSWD